jgi:hypothetical protein
MGKSFCSRELFNAAEAIGAPGNFHSGDRPQPLRSPGCIPPWPKVTILHAQKSKGVVTLQLRDKRGLRSPVAVA